MLSQTSSSISFIGKCAFAVCSAWMLHTVPASAQSASTGDNWSVGAPATDDGSVGIAATVDVPAPQNQGSVIHHSTAATPAPATLPGNGAPTAGTPTPTQPDATEYEDTDPSALSAFRSDLDPYGRWVDDSRYGRVWVPDANYVGSNFEPYVSNGHWALDVNNNWTWESDYPFGWVTFHYGRWVWVDSLGWSWVPGRRYAPAWVVWRVPTGDYAYVGWAPAPPTFVWYGTGLYWLDFYPPLPFVFCPSAYLFYPSFGAYMVRDRYFAATLVHHSVWYSTAPVYGRGYVSPSMSRARVPAQAMPSQRVSANPRAASMSRPSAAPRVGSPSPLGAGSRFGGGAPGRMPGNVTTRSTAMPGASRPSSLGASTRYPSSYTLRSGSTPSAYAGRGATSPIDRPASYSPRRVQSLGSTPSTGYSSPRSYSSPSYATPSSGYSAPRSSVPGYSAPSRSYSAPSYSAPSRSFSTPSYSAPSRSFSAPSYSAPSRSFSTPSFSAPSHSFSGGGGGFRSGGGGGFRSGGGGRHR